MEDEAPLESEDIDALTPTPGVSIDIRNSSLLPTGGSSYVPWRLHDVDNVNVGVLVADALLMCSTFRPQQQIETLQSFVIELAVILEQCEDRPNKHDLPWLSECVEAIRAAEQGIAAPLSLTDPTDLFPFLKGSRYQFLNGNPYQYLYGSANESHVMVEIRPDPAITHFTTAEGKATAFTNVPHRLVGIAAARDISAYFKGKWDEQVRACEDLFLETARVANLPEKLDFETWAPLWLKTAVDAIQKRRATDPPSG